MEGELVSRAAWPGDGAAGVAAFNFSNSAIRAFWASMVFCICSTIALSCLNSSGVCARTEHNCARADKTTTHVIARTRRHRLIVIFIILLLMILSLFARAEDVEV